MNEHTPKAVIKAIHCKRLALRAKLIAQTKKLAAEIKAAKQKKEQK